jgi:hypothetical protein
MGNLLTDGRVALGLGLTIETLGQLPVGQPGDGAGFGELPEKLSSGAISRLTIPSGRSQSRTVPSAPPAAKVLLSGAPGSPRGI